MRIRTLSNYLCNVEPSLRPKNRPPTHHHNSRPRIHPNDVPGTIQLPSYRLERIRRKTHRLLANHIDVTRTPEQLIDPLFEAIDRATREVTPPPVKITPTRTPVD